MVKDRKTPVAILGATGLVGQRLVQRLADHPWFSLAELAASSRRSGGSYGEVIDWKLPGAPPAAAAKLILQSASPDDVRSPLVLSALDASVAGDIEERFAAAGRAVVSNARNHRMDPDTPLVVPEVNADHLQLIATQRRRRGGDGFIAANPNCTVITLVLALAPLHRIATARKVLVTSLQAASGAGYPGVPALDLLDNVVPFIAGEEEKIVAEPLKIFGAVEGGRVAPARMDVSVQVHRVPVADGHLLSVSVELERPVTPEEAVLALSQFRGAPQTLGCPSAPEAPVVVVQGADRPQPRLDRDAGGGMAVVVGQVRRCPVLSLRFEALGHNTIRGAAGGTLLLAELLAAQGLLP